MLEILESVGTFLFTQIKAIWVLYTGSTVLCGFFTLWVLDRLFHIFDILKR